MAKDEAILKYLTGVIDPEVGLDVVSMGLVYNAEDKDGDIVVEMTMTSPACPMGNMIQGQARSALRSAFPQAKSVSVLLVWDPPWSPAMMTVEARNKLGLGVD
ncbi:MAG: metal-sulfur cluster assembly factor [Nitrospinae bacterium]|nr:metal-sulfur cluster assembly factor [Nitrospinota bacterium]